MFWQCGCHRLSSAQFLARNEGSQKSWKSISFFNFCSQKEEGGLDGPPCLDPPRIHGASQDGEGDVLGLCICAYVTNDL